MTFPTIAAGTRANEPIGGYANFIAYCNALAAGVDSVTTTAAGAALKANNLSDLASASTARTNLGLGTMATATATDYLTKAGNLSGIADLAVARTNLGLGSMATATASDYLSKAGNLSGIADPAAARTNLSLGDSATRDVGTTAGTVAAGDDSRLTGALQASGNLAAIADAAKARANLGLGTMATATASDYLSKAGNLSGITDTAVARTNLGLGTMATASASAYAALAGTAPFTAAQTINAPSAGTTALTLQGASGQSMPMLTVKNAAATDVIRLLADGRVLAGQLNSTNAVGAYAELNGASFIVNGRTSAASVPLIARGMAGQTGNLFEGQNSSGSALASISAAGLLSWNAAANQQTTVGAAGGASALPATPTKYLKVVDSTGATLVIPAYAAA